MQTPMDKIASSSYSAGTESSVRQNSAVVRPSSASTAAPESSCCRTQTVRHEVHLGHHGRLSSTHTSVSSGRANTRIAHPASSSIFAAPVRQRARLHQRLPLLHHDQLHGLRLRPENSDSPPVKSVPAVPPESSPRYTAGRFSGSASGAAVPSLRLTFHSVQTSPGRGSSATATVTPSRAVFFHDQPPAALPRRRPLADVVHAGDGTDEPGRGERPLRLPQLLRRVEGQRPAVLPGEGMERRLVRFRSMEDILHRRPGQMMLRQHPAHRGRHPVRRNALPAADAQMEHRGQIRSVSGNGSSPSDRQVT